MLLKMNNINRLLEIKSSLKWDFSKLSFAELLYFIKIIRNILK